MSIDPELWLLVHGLSFRDLNEWPPRVLWAAFVGYLRAAVGLLRDPVNVEFPNGEIRRSGRTEDRKAIRDLLGLIDRIGPKHLPDRLRCMENPELRALIRHVDAMPAPLDLDREYHLIQGVRRLCTTLRSVVDGFHLLNDESWVSEFAGELEQFREGMKQLITAASWRGEIVDPEQLVLDEVARYMLE